MPKKAESSWAALRRKSSALRKAADSLIRDAQQMCSQPNVSAISGYLVISGELEAWNKAMSALRPSIEEMLISLKQEGSEQSEIFDETLIRTLRARGLQVFGEAGLMVVEGVLHIETDAKRGSVKINGEPADDSSPESVIALVTSELDRVRKATTPAPRFLELLLRAYEEELQDERKEFGAQVPTSALFWRLAILRQPTHFRSNPSTANFREYPKEVLRADLFGLLQSGALECKQKRFRFSSGSDTAGAVFMLVPQLERTAHVGRIWFEHITK